MIIIIMIIIIIITCSAVATPLLNSAHAFSSGLCWLGSSEIRAKQMLLNTTYRFQNSDNFVMALLVRMPRRCFSELPRCRRNPKLVEFSLV